MVTRQLSSKNVFVQRITGAQAAKCAMRDITWTIMRNASNAHAMEREYIHYYFSQSSENICTWEDLAL